jgi:lysophospholipase L1-like esterase
MQNQRRSFLKKTALLSAIPVVSSFFNSAVAGDHSGGDGYTFLFQGDSITDGNRTHNNDWNHLMGHGYVYLIASRLWYELPHKQFHFVNRGVSGNKVTDLAARWQEDTIAIKPNLVSILVGINDVAAFINGDKSFTADQYETNYRALLQQTQQQLPGVQLVLCEPFALPVGRIKDQWNEYQEEVSKRQVIAKKLAVEMNAVYVPFQDAFTGALQKAPADYWIWDGIHPMPAGHELMARMWLKTVGEKLKFIRY